MLSQIIAMGDRFDSKRGITDSAEDDWLWTAGCSANGYGVLNVCHRQIRAHVVAYVQASGELIPPDRRVCHTCDVRRCTNNAGPLGIYVVAGAEWPRYGHLWLGTPAANDADREEKGRHPHAPVPPNRQARGEHQGLALLTESSVREIRTLYATGAYSTPQLGRQFGVHYSTIQQVIHRRTWRHVLP